MRKEACRWNEKAVWVLCRIFTMWVRIDAGKPRTTSLLVEQITLISPQHLASALICCIFTLSRKNAAQWSCPVEIWFAQGLHRKKRTQHLMKTEKTSSLCRILTVQGDILSANRSRLADHGVRKADEATARRISLWIDWSERGRLCWTPNLLFRISPGGHASFCEGG